MDADSSAIYFGLILYLLYVLVPLIPAVLIYKIFPATSVGATGILGNLKINSSGAFAAYIIVVVLGYFVVQHIQELISLSATKSMAWEVSSKVVLMEKDSNGDLVKSKSVSDKHINELLDIRTNPNYTNKDLSSVDFLTYSKDKFPKITYIYPGYESRTIDLNSGDIEINLKNKVIVLGEIRLEKINQEYNPGNFESIENMVKMSPIFIPYGEVVK